jgi:hypothetical protein
MQVQVEAIEHDILAEAFFQAGNTDDKLGGNDRSGFG